MSSLNSLNQTVPFHDTASIKFNYIRFPQYRIACKLRDFQKISKFTLIDQFNTLESFREASLNGNPDLNCKIGLAQVSELLYNLFKQLSQRLPENNTISAEQCSQTVFNFVRDILDPSTSGLVNVFDLKILLTILCQSSYSNKLRYIFTLVSESFSLLNDCFYRFLSTISAIVTYFEGESVNFVIDQEFPIAGQNDFVAKFMQDSPESQTELTSWLVIYHRLPEVENIRHDEECSACKSPSFVGFRYKCKECSHYILCQECFWSGKSSGSHNPDKHSCKEYIVDKKALRGSLRRSFRNSFRLKPKKPIIPSSSSASNMPTEKVFNMSNIITSPLSKRKQIKTNFEYKFQDYHKSPIKIAVQSDEHATIKHYLSIINDKTNKPPPLDTTFNNIDFEKTIQDLENQNRDLLTKIAEIKLRKKNASSMEAIYEDLKNQRFKQLELEEYLNNLQAQKQILMMQLDKVMKTLSSNENAFSDISPMSNSLNTDCSGPDKEFVHL